MVFECREALARLFGAPDSRRIVFTLNATQALNTAIYGILRPGDRVITTAMEHNSTMRPLRDLEHRGVISLEVLPCDRAGRLDLGRLEAALQTRGRGCSPPCTPPTSAAPSCRCASWARMARATGTLLLVDAAQSAGALPIDVEADGIDLLAFTGHKALFGPQGTGGLWARPGVEPEPLFRGGTGSNSELEEQPEFWPDRLESGTQNAVGIAGLLAGVSFVAETGLPAIRAREEALTKRLIDGLKDVAGITLLGPEQASERSPIISVTFAGLVPSEAGFLLEEGFGVLTRVGLHCAPAAHRTLGTYPQGTVRFAPGFFTSDAEIEAALEGCRYLAAKKRGGR